MQRPGSPQRAQARLRSPDSCAGDQRTSNRACAACRGTRGRHGDDSARGHRRGAAAPGRRVLAAMAVSTPRDAPGRAIAGGAFPAQSSRSAPIATSCGLRRSGLITIGRACATAYATWPRSQGAATGALLCGSARIDCSRRRAAPVAGLQPSHGVDYSQDLLARAAPAYRPSSTLRRTPEAGSARPRSPTRARGRFTAISASSSSASCWDAAWRSAAVAMWGASGHGGCSSCRRNAAIAYCPDRAALAAAAARGRG
jgi:hypothetical protein